MLDADDEKLYVAVVEDVLIDVFKANVVVNIF